MRERIILPCRESSERVCNEFLHIQCVQSTNCEREGVHMREREESGACKRELERRGVERERERRCKLQ